MMRETAEAEAAGESYKAKPPESLSVAPNSWDNFPRRNDSHGGQAVPDGQETAACRESLKARWEFPSAQVVKL